MPSFTPPTYGEAITGKEETNGGSADHRSMWRQFGTPISVGYTVLITSGVASTYPGVISPTVHQIKGNAEVPNATATFTGADAGSGEGGLAYFRGGQEYTITAAEDTILKAAGYTTSTS